MKKLSVEDLKHELEGILRVQTFELNRFAERISKNHSSFDQSTLEIALRLSDQALVHALKTEERLKEVKYLSLLRKV